MLLDQRLESYAESGTYPFHMPGHKRACLPFPNLYQIDITEIDGFDNLHHADGILKEAQQRAADLYQAEKAWFLVNGSTCGLLTAISAAVPKGSKVLVARNCHKAVYHAIYLRELVPVYMYPEITSQGLQGRISERTLSEAIEECPEARAVILTSPTYDGIVSDIRSLAELTHRQGMVLIIDQAHGAHFGLSSCMPENAGKLGADLVVVSVHKTLPAFTQTALLLSYSKLVPEEKLESFLDIYETSSPSYILMAGIDRCISITAREGKERFAELRRNLDWFYQRTSQLQLLHVPGKKDFTDIEAYEVDDSKILILTERAGITGADLAEELRKVYGIELEMASGNYGLALATLMDTREGFRKLSDALIDMDWRLTRRKNVVEFQEVSSPALFYRKKKRAMEIHEAADAQQICLPFWKAEGKTSAGYLYLYPPGIPMIVPGEVIDRDLLKQLELACRQGLEICGLSVQNEKRVKDSKAEEEYGIPVLCDGEEFQW